MTAEKFVPDGLGGEAGARLYRTGDRARHRGDGTIEFLGRADQQVKLRGFRIEPGEVEGVLSSHPEVSRAAVAIREDRPGDKRLVAYFEARSASGPTIGEVRSYLEGKLPGYMVPSAFVRLESLPLTANGKVDRRALPAPEAAETMVLSPAAPRTPVEELMAGIWQDVLGLDRLGLESNFFHLGGHSLLATRVVSRLRSALGVELPLRELFEAPTVSELSSRVERALRFGAGVETPPLVAVPRGEALPLSFAQQRLWFIDQLEPESALYNIPVALRVTGGLDLGVLAAVLGEIARRHESLRTTFEAADGEPVQVIRPAGRFALPVVDLSGLDETAREAAGARRVDAEAGRPFDLVRGPLFRAVAVRLGPTEHLVLATMHHIVSDGWSMGILVREVTVLYEAFSAGRPSPLADLELQYADFAAWQRGWLAGEVLEREIAAWRERLAGAPALLELPTDRLRPAVQSFRGAVAEVRFAPGLAGRVREIARRRSATVFMVLVSGFQALLSRLSGQRDVSVGTPIAGRNRLEIEGLIGFFVNTLVLRTELFGDPPFGEIVNRVRSVSLDGHAHQEMPFEKLVEELAPERSLAHSPLFQVMLVLQNGGGESLAVEGLRLRTLDSSSTTAKFDLTFELAETEGGLAGSLEYSTALFDATTMARLASHFEHLMTGALADPDLALSALPLLSGAERWQVAGEWNDTPRVEKASERCLHELFEDQVRRTPEATAIVFGDDRLSYAELNRRANRLARHLIRLGLPVGARVVLLLERSIDQLVGLFATLKAGGAYVPLDPGQPLERLAKMLDDVGPAAILTRDPIGGRLPPGDAAVVWLDRDGDAMAKNSDRDPRLRLAPGHLAYVLYTSGSTGVPKGIGIRHASVTNLFEGLERALGTRPGPALRATLNASLFFDASVQQIVQLARGHCLFLVPEELRLDAEAFVSWLAEREIDLLDCTPAHLRLLLEAGLGERERRFLRRVMVGGEELERDLWRRLCAIPGVSFYNAYGPTESTVDVSIRPVTGPHPTIGRPIPGVRFFLSDAALALVPVGVAGELCLGGSGLAFGYLNRPALTAERFVPDPWSEVAGERLYRTGDLMKWRPEGELEYLGRVDHQVKVRGFRIELGEIESVLRSGSGVREAVVLAREQGGGEKRLVAYVVAEEGERLSSTALGERLRERLPDYMVPGAFVFLAELPLTPNGKVDRRALPNPETTIPEESGRSLPRTPLEQLVAGIWGDVLGLPQLGREANFFALGGHSLLATRVVSRLRGAVGVELPLRDLFEAPTVAGLSSRVERALRAGTGSIVPPIAPTAREGALPLSFAQQRLWFIDQLDPASPLYNMPVALRVSGALRLDVLRRVLQEIVRRHESLRTVFPSVDGEPVQAIRPEGPFVLPTIDLARLEAAGREAAASFRVGKEAGRPFDLAEGPLFRAAAVRLGPDEHLVLATMHHIVSDGWSMGILVREVTALYGAFAAGRPSPLPELEVQYADYAAWQRGWLSDEVLARELSFWRESLTGAPGLLELPTDRPRPAVQSFGGAEQGVRLSSRLAEAVRQLGRRRSATAFMVLAAGFQALLSRESGQLDVSLGTPIAGRTQLATEGLIGFFVNTLVLRTDLSGDPPFGEILDRVRAGSLEGHAHQEVPFEKLVEELAPERSLSHPPLFQVMFLLQNAGGEALEVAGLRLRAVGSPATTAKFDLTLALEETGGELIGSVEYATALFDPSTMARLVGHFERLLAGALADPDLALSALPLLGPAERWQAVGEWNDTQVEKARDLCLHSLFEAQAKRTPSATALVAGDEELTYGELDGRANRLAHHLRSLGVGPEVRVALLLLRTAEMVVAVLGVLKAGGAYVPLDPSLPDDRLSFMLADSGSAVVLSQERSWRSSIPGVWNVVLLDREESRIASPPQAAPISGVDPDNLAYVIYTSGSTGRPKGVAIRHGSAVDLIRWSWETFGREEMSGVLASTSLSFDLSVFELFAPLSRGGTAILADNALALPYLARPERVSLVNTVPSVLSELLRNGPLPVSVRTVSLAGEALPRSLADRLHAEGTVERLWNLYGPSEDTTYSTFARVGWEGTEAPTIGRSISASRAYVVDGAREPVPLGVAGELYLGGSGLARGYLARPDLTAERFVPDAFGGGFGERLYRTGDRARWRGAGELDYLGRLDHQVKVRGFRIELGEIEAALRAQTSIREAVVVVRDAADGDRRLVAYVVPDAGRPATPEVLRRGLAARLPEYMVPGAFVFLAELPLTPNGKLDRRALPAPEMAVDDGRTGFLPSRTPIEEVVAAVWSDVLGLERVGAGSNFFDLGGHSLVATRVVSRLRSALGVELALRELFEAPTVEGLAGRIERALRVGAGVEIPPLVPVPRDRALPPSFAQQRLWFIDRLEPESAAYNMPVALEVTGGLDLPVLARVLGEIVRRHEVLRTVFRVADGEPVQVVLPAERVALPLVDLSGLTPENRQGAALWLAGREATRPFDLARGPLLRAGVLRLGVEQHVVLATMHHIVSDGWSMGILVREVMSLYGAFSAGRPSPLAELPVQYADYAVWQRSWLAGETLVREIASWRERLGGAPTILELPTDRPRPSVQGDRGAEVSVRLPSPVWTRVWELGRRQAATPFMVLLAAFQALLARHGGQAQVSVGTPIAGRTRLETEGLIGFFVNTLVLSTDLSGDPRFAEIVERAREVSLHGHTHQEVPFEKLVEELAPERSLAHSPLFQAMFVLEAPAEEGLAVEGLRLRPFAAEGGTTAKFDLTLALAERGGGLAGTIEYRTELFDSSTMTRLAAHFGRLLDAALSRSDLPLSKLPLLSGEERAQALVEWNDTSVSAPKPLLPEVLAGWARRTPDATAIVFGDRQLTYRETERAARRLAGRLRARGLGLGDLVAIHMERAPELVVAVLGVMAAGAAYLPLDPSLPSARLTYIFDDARAAAVLSQQRLSGLLPAGDLPVIELDRPEEGDPAGRDDLSMPGPNDPAYVIYTSGSTGMPKGAVLHHRGLANLLDAMSEVFELGPGDRMLQFAALGFDASIWEIGLTIQAGAALHLAPRESLAPGPDLIGLLKEREITQVTLPSSALAALPHEPLPALRNLIVAGEACPADLPSRWAPGRRFYNAYGPTEATVCSTFARIVQLDRRPPIGRSFAGVEAILLDATFEPVPIGVAAELFVGGLGLGHGYLRRPALTAERFIPHPHGTEPGARLYRTGDLARWLPNGEIEYLGRLDHQVKLRGFRIELGEIEAELASRPEVREAVVLAREDLPGEQRLVAYVVPEAGMEIAVPKLRAGLKERLPEYMVPAAFVVLDALPLTPNGKVDRRALPVPERDHAAGGSTAPRTPAEEMVAVVWSDVLKIEGIGTESNFFDLGGHSLLATRVMSRLVSALGVDLPLRDLFEAPTVRELSVRIERALRSGSGAAIPPLVPAPRQQALPLSFAQQRLWFIDQLEPESPLYNMPVALGVTGGLDLGVLQLVLAEIVRRHEALRTVFAAVDGAPVQVILPPAPLALPLVDLSGLAATSRRAIAMRRVGEEAGRPFDLARGPLFRAGVLRLGAEDHVVLATMHHIVSDGWSMEILVREVTALYAAFAAGRSSPLPDLALQYADYAAWQRGWLHGEALERELAYWRGLLGDAPGLLDLPTDRPRPDLPSSRGAEQEVRFSARLAEQVRELGRRRSATGFMVWLAGFQTLLARYGGRFDVSVGTPIAGRNRLETEGLIGFFVNTLVLRTNLDGDPGFDRILDRVREVVLEAHAHQDVPFERLVEELAPERSLSWTPLFQVMLVLQNAGGEALEVEGLKLRAIGSAATRAKFELTLSVEEDGGDLYGSIEYATDLFDRPTILRLGGHLERLLGAAISRPDMSVAELPLLADAERTQLEREWNDTQRIAPEERCLHELIERQAYRTPEAVAVVCGGERLLYRELNSRADGLARHLRARGIGPETRVGLCTGPCLEMAVGLLGILKAGAAYLPLDPGYPRERLAFMQEDAGISLLLVQPGLEDRAALDPSRVVSLADDWEATAREAADPLDPLLESAAYVLYTSGSTGRPKGVVVPHRGLANHGRALARRYGLEPGDRVLQFASLSFDVAAEELFPSWLAGASVVLWPERDITSPADFNRFVEDQALSVLNLPTTYWQAWIAELEARGERPSPTLRLVVVGSEAVSPAALETWGRVAPEGVRWTNAYGLTEATITTTLFEREAILRCGRSPFVPIGRPIENVGLHLLDPRGIQVPSGVPGELYIGGGGLARGYLRRPELTAERFVPDAFSGEPGARLYRTGDRVRFLPEGNLEYLGRFDHQVKVRGFRIELGEVEALLAGRPEVREAVVLAREDAPGQQRLVAYLVANEPQPLASLREVLRRQLPVHMMPSAFVMLDRLPRLPNGKVDRRALPPPETSGAEGETGLPALRTPIEELVATVWGDVLGVEQVGWRSNFFDLGGHSLVATRVVSRLRSALGVELALRELFEAPTVGELAGRIERALRLGAGVETPPLVPVPRDRALPLSFAQQRLWFIDQLEPDSSVYNIPIALEVTGDLDLSALERVLGEIVRRHEALRTVFAAVDGEPAQVILPAGRFALALVDLSGLATRDRRSAALRLVRREAVEPFDLARGSLFRAAVLRLGAEEHTVLATMHHVVSDGWSIGILVREVMALYGAFVAGRPSPLAELPVQYADYAAWQRSWLAGPVLEREIAAWRERLAGAPAVLELPIDRPRPPVRGDRGAAVALRLPGTVWRAARELGRRRGATPFMVLLAGFQALLSRYGGQADVSVGTPIAGRTRLETEGLIGFFVNTLVLRTDLSGDPRFGELVERVREVSLHGHTHQDVPFEKLVEELAPERSLSHSPLFQVMFVLQNAPEEALAVEGLQLRPVDVEGTTAKFDISLALEERGGELFGAFGYSAELFEATTMIRLAGHFERLMAGAAGDPGLALSALPWLGEAERWQLAGEWNDTQAEPSGLLCLHELFEAQVRRAPDAMAVVFGEEHLSFGGLNRGADRLARHLVDSGVNAGSRIALLMDRSVDLVVGLLAAQKAGGAYVPLDPKQPAERLARMLGDLSPAAILTHDSLAERLPRGEWVTVRLDRDRERIADRAAAAPAVAVSPEHLAYVIYTSGSTGVPKGIGIRHRSVFHLLGALERLLGTAGSAALRASANAPFYFDASVKQIIQLVRGHCLCIVPEELRSDGEAFVSFLAEQAIDLLDCTPAQLRMLLDAGLGSEAGAPRRVLIGGEAIDQELWSRLAEADGIEYFNVYGPSECTVDAAARRISPSAPRPTIGRPISNVSLFVLDSTFGMAPMGVAGELSIGGAGLAVGYLNRPVLTADRFVPDALGGGFGERLYRTGDRVRWRQEGELEFLGRLDHQVKVRGFRIELGEIESALAGRPEVRDAAVLAWTDGPGDGRLVAYVVAEPGRKIEGSALRAALAERLPEYMVPGTFIVLPSMPLTKNGKLDRRALPAPERGDAEAGFAAPRTPIEELVATVWSDVLGLDRISWRSNFFDLGGHSLVATRVVSRLRSALGVELALRELFEAPTVEGLAGRIEHALRAGAGIETPPLIATPRSEASPLSFAQQRLWFLDQLEPESAAYNIPIALKVTGGLDLGVLSAVLGEIVRRHEALRTVFVTVEGEPAQVILPAGSLILPTADLSRLPEGGREAAALFLAAEEAARPFDLARGPLFRAAALRLGPEEHVVLATMHHIVSDGWSIEVLVREVTALYGAFAAGLPSPLPELPLQYADYAAWQRGWLQGEVLARELAYWRGRLGGAPGLLELPTDRPRPAVQSFRGAVEEVRFAPELAAEVRQLARRRSATVFMVLASGFQALLARYSGQRDVSVGTPIAGRNRLETEGLIGFFVNTLVLRTDLSGDPPFGEIVERVRTVSLEGHAHQEVPFERLVEELAPERSLAHSPLFQVMFLLQNAGGAVLEMEGLRLSALGSPATTSKFDLTLALAESEGGLAGSVEYSTALFEASTIARLVACCERLLAAAVAEPDLPLSALPLLGAAERQQLVEWSGVRRPYPRRSLHGLFEEQAARTLDAVALVSEEGAWSYRELDARANGMAHRLRSLGVGPEMTVGLCAERSAEQVTAILGILKAGGAYLPLDPSHPAERLAFQLVDAGAPLLLAPENLSPSLAGAVQVVPLESLREARSERGPGVEVGSENLAYVMYTSGSTGLPKGVAVTHKNVVRLVEGTDYVRFGPEEVFLQLAPASFDASTLEIWGALLHGGRLVLGPAGAPSLAEIGTALHRHGVTTLWLTAGLFHEMVDGELEGLRPVRQLLAGGDRLSPAHVRRVLSELPGTRLINGYGPTEGTTFTCCHELTPGEEIGDSVSIGRPIANTTAWVLDEGLRPVPAGVVGELYAGGDGVARGYVGRPDLTAEKFVPDGLGGEAGARLYRTGDRARHRGDGTIEFLGRADQQVKLRGFRIEPGEVEGVLSSHPEISRAAVAIREDRPGDKRLVAYFEARSASGPTLGEVRSYLEGKLPGYMVPSALVRLESLPLTTNGKVDRRALPAPEAAEAALSLPIAPRTPVEELMAGIWQDVLGLDRLGLESNFFELGGHSLLATRVVSRLRSALGVELPLRELFEAPTVSELSSRVERALRSGAGVETPPLVAVPRGPALPLSFAQQRLWFIDQLEPESALYNIPVALRVTGGIDLGVLAAVLGEIVRRHESIRTTFEAADGEPVQVIRPAGRFALPVVDLSSLNETARETVAERRVGVEAGRPFDLARGPLFRAVAVRLGPTEHLVLATMHHIVSDGWSMGILVREVTALYEAFSAGRPSPLADLLLQYADFAAWQRGWLAGEVLEREIAAWRERLSGAPALLELPTDRPRPAVQSFRGAVAEVRFAPELAGRVREIARRRSATVFMVLVSGFQALLSRLSGQLDVSVGTPIAGRNRLEIEGLIGFFVNTLVLRTELSGDPDFAELIGRVREITLHAHLHQEMPFEKLVEELAPERSLAHSPLFQVMLVLQNTADESLEIEGLRVRPVAAAAGETAKFDLTLALGENAREISGSIEYSTGLFDATTATRLAGHLERLLESALADPGLPLSELPLLSPAERVQILEEWNETPPVEGPNVGLHELFEDQALRTPEAPALAFGEQVLSYAELNARANRLAHHLRDLGVAPELRVGVMLPRTAEMVVAVLAVLKAGGAYVPLDPAYPRERLATILADGGADLLVTEERLAAPFGGEVRSVCLERDAASIAGRSAEAPEPRSAAENLAYVIYTSGSTGRPKGVAITHASAVALVAWARRTFDAGELAGVLASTSLSFDLSVFELFAPLASGGTVILAENVLELPSLPWADRVRLVNTVPSAMAELVRGGGLPAGVRTVNLAGEALPRWLADRLASAGTVERLWNLYGPTEDTTYSTAGLAVFGAEGAPPIGRPIPGTRAYVVEPSFAPAPAGVAGELLLGGAGLARGYLGRPDLTAERFVPDPFGAGGRLYRTGDLARWRPSGELEYLGRLDHQVKVRGFRIELGEIEAALASRPEVRDAVVLARQDPSGDRRLVAYVVPETERGIDAAALRAALKVSLPEYMVPGVFMALAALPLTPNGKVDRRALPAPERPDASARFVAPRDLVERELVRIWEDLLGFEPVGVLDDFFALGGHSLLAVRLMARIRAHWERSLPVVALFSAPTVEGLAARVRREGGSDDPADRQALVEIQRGEGGRALFCVHPAGGNVLCYIDLARCLGNRQPFYAFQRPNREVADPPLDSLETIAAHYLEELRNVQPQGPYLLAGWSMGGVLAFEMAQQLGRAGQEVEALILIDSVAPLSASQEALSPLAILADLAREHIWGLAGRSLPFTFEDLAALDGVDPLEWVYERAIEDRVLPPDLTLGEVRRLFDIYALHLQAMRRYAGQAYDGRVLLIRAADEEDAEPADDETLGWSQLLSDDPVLGRSPGDHSSMVLRPHAAALAELIRPWLAAHEGEE
ncbi:MAG TPA: non-ribosomal peptide synthase/polyketide synthase [Thermoanaerobaculia bacterium]|nr:non-ribosomal peptide synthase/polyketide synthase [Thermoanaerobaculia bacterium]